MNKNKITSAIQSQGSTDVLQQAQDSFNESNKNIIKALMSGDEEQLNKYVKLFGESYVESIANRLCEELESAQAH